MNRLALSLLLASLSLPAAAQQPAGTPPARPKIGIGIAVAPLGTAAISGTTEVMVPIQVAPNLRIEPSAGLLTSDGNGVYQRVLSLGVGVLLQQRLDAATDLYFGGRLRLGFGKVDVDGAGSDTGNDVILAGAVGGEHFLGGHFSLGLEAQLGYYSSFSLGDTSGLYTSGTLMARVFF